MTEKMFQEREKPWHMDVENGAELEDSNEEELAICTCGMCGYCIREMVGKATRSIGPEAS